MNELEIGVAVAFAAGVLSFLSPCVLPLVPSYLSFVSGVGIEELEGGGGDVKRVAFIHSLFFVLGFSLIFLALGASATFVGRLLREYQVWIARIGGLLIIFFGLYLVGVRPFKGMARERRIHLRNKPLGYLVRSRLDPVHRTDPGRNPDLRRHSPDAHRWTGAAGLLLPGARRSVSAQRACHVVVPVHV